MLQDVPPGERLHGGSVAMLATLLRLGRFRLSAEEFSKYRLYRRDVTLHHRKEFVGAWARDLVFADNDLIDAKRANSKGLAYSLFEDAGLPFPRVHAVIGRSGPEFPAPHLSTEADLRNFLSSASFPLFFKPDYGMHGDAAFLAERLDHQGNIVLADGSILTIAEALLKLLSPSRPIFLIQDAVIPHQDISDMTQGPLASNRLLVLVRNGSVHFHRAVVRIPTGNSMVDNFNGGLSGNLVGAVDVETGKVIRVIDGVGYGQRQVTEHPQSQRSFSNWHMPYWQEAREIVRQAAGLFPGLPTQAWDFAISSTGPKLLELNPRGQFPMIQAAYNRGIGDEQFRKHLNKRL